MTKLGLYFFSPPSPSGRGQGEGGAGEGPGRVRAELFDRFDFMAV